MIKEIQNNKCDWIREKREYWEHTCLGKTESKNKWDLAWKEIKVSESTEEEISELC